MLAQLRSARRQLTIPNRPAACNSTNPLDILVPVFAHHADRLAIRWTIGDVRPRGFEMLRLSIACAFALFGSAAEYIICVNTIAVDDARRRTGELPIDPQWRQITPADVPGVLRAHVDADVMEGMGWKLAPLRTRPEKFELSLDNDCIVWALPDGMRQWLESENGFLLAEDVDRRLGNFDDLCAPGAWNAGIRGLPPHRDLKPELDAVLTELEARRGRARLLEEIEEQGLQAAAMTRTRPLFTVATHEVSLCSPFWPRSPEPGSCGAHFVGMNAWHIPWNYYDRPADEWLREHWERLRPELYTQARLELPLRRAA